MSAELAERDGTPGTVSNETAFLVDCLPVIRRTVSRSGFVVDHVQYYCDALKPWIARRDRLGKFVLRRDPRDISRIWALDPDGATYVPVPYRALSRPPISIWEQRAAVARLREQGRANIDEQSLFAMVAQMREITDTAAATTRRARRDRERRAASTDGRPNRPVTPTSWVTGYRGEHGRTIRGDRAVVTASAEQADSDLATCMFGAADRCAAGRGPAAVRAQ